MLTPKLQCKQQTSHNRPPASVDDLQPTHAWLSSDAFIATPDTWGFARTSLFSSCHCRVLGASFLKA